MVIDGIDIGPQFPPAELHHLESLCELGARYGNDKDVKIGPSLTPFERWVWHLGRRETEWVAEHAGAMN